MRASLEVDNSVTAESTASTLPLSVVVITYNEELNLPSCLESVAGWAGEVVVVDSGSTDDTVKIARKWGARVLQHPFVTHAGQWQWALQNAGIANQWVLGLDADQRVTPELRDQIRSQLTDPAANSQPAGFFVSRRQIFRGKWIRHGGYYPKHLLKLFRIDRVFLDEKDLVDHHFYVQGPTEVLTGDLIEDNRNESDISVWIEKHNRYAVRQAREEFLAGRDGFRPRGSPSGDPHQRVWWMKGIWARLPLFVRPCAYFIYRYFFRLGFLDGREGFIFHFLQAFWYRLLVDIHLYDLRKGLRAWGLGLGAWGLGPGAWGGRRVALEVGEFIRR